jgi:hypothetical protein
MTGLPDFNYPAFDSAALELARSGYDVLNPARRGVVESWGWADYLRLALGDVLAADGVATLPGWTRSRGASLEVHVARRLGMPVRPVHEWPAAR